MKFKILIIIILMGLCYDIALVFSFEKIYPEKTDIEFIGEIIKEKSSTDYYYKYIIKVMKCNINYSKNTKLILYSKSNDDFFPGDIIQVKGTFEKGEKARNYKGFNYRNYLKQNKIYGVVFAEETNIINNHKDLSYIFSKIRTNLENKIDNLYENEYSAFLKGLLIGDKNQLDNNLITSFQTANISHILSISGLHISYIIIGINFLLQNIINSKKVRNIILIFFLILFLILTGSSVSCMRACIMNIFAILSSIFYRKNNFFTSFFISFIIILFFNPYNIFNVGMWISYGGTIGIVFLYDFIYKILNRKLKYSNKIKNFILKSFSLSISAQILIFPIMLYVFNNISLSFFVANIIISFFIGYVLAFGYISILIFLPLSKIISYIETLFIWIIFKTANIASKIPLSKIYVTTPSIFLIIMYYLVFSYSVIYFKNNKIFILKVIFKKNIKIFINKSKNIFIILIIIVIITNINQIDFHLKIYFVDVGQGDCTFIITPFGKRIIIDGGEGNSGKYDYGKNVVFPYLLDRKVKRIDYLIISHCDSDHIGGLIYILENMKVENILIGLQPENSNQLEKLIEIANNKKVKIRSLEKGNIIKIEKNINIEVLWPDRSNLILENALNNNSLVFKLKYNNFSVMFTGDIEEFAEEEILDKFENNLNILNSSILKIAHHGSKSSSTSLFLEKVNPEIALIGVGKNNKFGHPSLDVIKRLEKNNIKIYRTDQMGEISINVNSKGKFNIKQLLK